MGAEKRGNEGKWRRGRRKRDGIDEEDEELKNEADLVM